MKLENPKSETDKNIPDLKAEKRAADLRIKQAKEKELEEKINKAILKRQIDQLNAEGSFGTPVEPRKSLNSLLRNQNKFLVNAVAIFDRKAALLIRTCTLTISGLIAFHEYLDNHVVNGYMISTILISGLLMALALSILSTKPHTLLFQRLFQRQIKPEYPGLKHNLFLSPFNSNLKEYEEAMIEVINSQDLQLGNQIRANFILGKTNSLDAILLSYAYNVFLFTFLIAGIVFIVSRMAG